MNELERKFKAVLDEHGAEVAEAYEKALALSDKYGIPVGSHVPKGFRKKYPPYEGPAPEYDYVCIDTDFVVSHCKGIDKEYWQSSTVECEWRGGF